MNLPHYVFDEDHVAETRPGLYITVLKKKKLHTKLPPNIPTVIVTYSYYLQDIQTREFAHFSNEILPKVTFPNLYPEKSRLAEERLQVVEDRRKLEEQRQKFVSECEQKKKDEQNLILGKRTPSGVKGTVFVAVFQWSTLFCSYF